MKKQLFLLCLIILAIPGMAVCDDVVAEPQVVELTSRGYVDESLKPKVDTSANANQTMAGTYNVSGRLDVVTPALPEI